MPKISREYVSNAGEANAAEATELARQGKPVQHWPALHKNPPDKG